MNQTSAMPPLDPEIAVVVERLPEMPPLTLQAVAWMRAHPFIPVSTDEELSREGRYRVAAETVPASSTAPAIPLLICRPAAGATAAPVLLYLHGGGMMLGTCRDGLEAVLDLAEPVGAAVVSVGYRLAPETPHPGPVEDCHAALRWVAAHRDELNIDPDRIVVIGGSAGGGLAAGLVLRARDSGGPAVAGQLLMCPMLDDRNDTASAHQMAGQPMWNRAANEVGWSALLGNAAGGPDVDHYAAPARATDLSGLPPTYIDVGSRDTFRDEDVAYADRIWRAGGVAELHVWPGGCHGFEGIAPFARLSGDAAEARVRWLRRVLQVAP